MTNIKGANKDANIYVGRSTTVHNLLFCSHTLCMNYVTNTFLLVSSSERSKQLLCFVHGQGQKTEQKHTTKNFHQFHNHSPLLTMMCVSMHHQCILSGFNIVFCTVLDKQKLRSVNFGWNESMSESMNLEKQTNKQTNKLVCLIKNVIHATSIGISALI